MVLMSKWWDRSKVLLSLEQEVERQTTEEQIAENEGHEQFKESQRIEAIAKVQEGTGAANNIVDFFFFYGSQALYTGLTISFFFFFFKNSNFH